jgi:hypothetical protein
MTATEFTIRRKVLTLVGAKFHIYKQDGSLLGFCKQKAFKLKEDIRVYSDESMEQERFVIKARSVIDFSAAYDVCNSGDDAPVGALRRRGLSSMLRDEWVTLDPDDNQIGSIREDSLAKALVRRFLCNLIPQSYSLTDNSGRTLAELRTHFNPFVHRMTVTVYPDDSIPAQLILAAGILLLAIEGRQK